MNLAEQALVGRTFKTMLLPDGFSVYCYKCNAIMEPGTLVQKFDGATYVHEICPSTPLKTFSPHKYGGTR